MPVLRLADWMAEESQTSARRPVGIAVLAESGGLTQFGARIEERPRGVSSSILHWHAAEDEMVLVLDGTVTLVKGAAETLLAPGDVATFRAGVPVGHGRVNRGTAPVRTRVVGTRAAADTITCPAHDRILHRDAAGPDRWTDAAANPARSPYREPPH